MDDTALREKVLKRQLTKDNALFQSQHITILGCGGLGSNIAMMLSRAGIGKLSLYDYDTIEYSNLNRQNYTVDEIGQSKVAITKAKIQKTVPYVRVEAFDQRIDPDYLESILHSSSLFIEAFDDQQAKAMAVDIFMHHPDKYLITASGVSGLGQLGDIQVKYCDNLCLIGNFKTTPDQGLYLPYVSIVASLQALEALKWIKNGGTYGK